MRSLDSVVFASMRTVGVPLRRILPSVAGYRTINLAESHVPESADRLQRARRPPQTEFCAHPATATRIVVIYPGLGATFDGESRQLTESYPFRYRHLANRLQAKRIAAVVRVSNPPCGYDNGGKHAIDRLKRAIDFAFQHARALCGMRDPELCLMGFSAGAGAAAALSGEYQPSRLLLVAPSGDAGPQRIMDGIKTYAGHLSLLVGECDEVVGRDAAVLFDEISPSTRSKEVVFVPGCDHFFTAPEHDRLLEATAVNFFSASSG